MPAGAASRVRMPRTRFAPHLVMFAAMLIWSANATVVKLGLEHVRPASFFGARFLMGAVASWIIALAVHRRRALAPPRARVPLVAIIGIGANQVFFAFGLNLTTAVDASLIQGLTPLFAGAMVMLLARGRLGNKEITALLLGLAGVSIVVLATPAHGGGSVTGDLINLGAPLSYAFFLVFTASDAARLPATRITPWALTGGLVILLPLGLVDAVRAPEDWLASLPELFFAGLLSTTFAYTAGLWALPRLGATAAAIYSYLQPPLGAAIGALFLGEPYVPIQLAGTAIILLAAYLGGSQAAPVIGVAQGAPPGSEPDSAPITGDDPAGRSAVQTGTNVSSSRETGEAECST